MDGPNLIVLVSVGSLGLGDVHDLVALLGAACALSSLADQTPLMVRVLAEEVDSREVEGGAAVLAFHILSM